jgi:hypothetical protein
MGTPWGPGGGGGGGRKQGAWVEGGGGGRRGPEAAVKEVWGWGLNRGKLGAGREVLCDKLHWENVQIHGGRLGYASWHVQGVGWYEGVVQRHRRAVRRPVLTWHARQGTCPVHRAQFGGALWCRGAS